MGAVYCEYLPRRWLVPGQAKKGSTLDGKKQTKKNIFCWWTGRQLLSSLLLVSLSAQNITALPRQFLPPYFWVTCRLLFIFLPVIE